MNTFGNKRHIQGREVETDKHILIHLCPYMMTIKKTKDYTSLIFQICINISLPCSLGAPAHRLNTHMYAHKVSQAGAELSA